MEHNVAVGWVTAAGKQSLMEIQDTANSGIFKRLLVKGIKLDLLLSYDVFQ